MGEEIRNLNEGGSQTMDLEKMGQAAKEASLALARLSGEERDRALTAAAAAVEEHGQRIIEANRSNVEAAEQAGLPGPMVKRLTLDEKKIRGMASALRELVAIPDPVGYREQVSTRPNGLEIYRLRVPFGVVGVIYESRPNVTVEAAGICLKSGNAIILKGGTEAQRTNEAIVAVLRGALRSAGVPESAIQLVERPSRKTAQAMMRLDRYIDLLIPRGGAGLIRTVVEGATVPVIQTGVGNCHVYVDGAADLEMARQIVLNAKLSNPAVCNAMETLLVDRAVAATFLPVILSDLARAGVTVHGCPETCRLFVDAVPATEEDWLEEYLGLEIAVRVVDGSHEAIRHINTYGSKHSEAIVTENEDRAVSFVAAVDAAAVYVNASTRFTDGGEFGFGGEIGISTQKLHARGPLGPWELTTFKYVVHGTGQVR